VRDMDKYRNMAFSCYGNISGQLELSEHLKVLREFSGGQIRNDQFLETLQYLALRFGHGMRQHCQRLEQALQAEDADERNLLMKQEIRSLIEYLDRNHREEFSNAISIWK